MEPDEKVVTVIRKSMEKVKDAHGKEGVNKKKNILFPGNQIFPGQYQADNDCDQTAKNFNEGVI
ncbi:MAG: hypothetical protein P8013_13830 [Candidatus Sulfobium sp.]